MNLKRISDALQNPKTEAARLRALAELEELLREANELYSKYKDIGRGWKDKVKSLTL